MKAAIIADTMLKNVFAVVNPGNTIKLKIANVPNPTNMGVAVFLLKTFSNSSFIFGRFVKLKDGWVQGSDKINLKRGLKFDG